MTISEFVYKVFTGGASDMAIHESISSYLPGRTDGPADAYRHLLLASELTRRFGKDHAKTILDLHETTGGLENQTAEAEAMDRHNNELGINLGRVSSSWEDTVRLAKQLIEMGYYDMDATNSLSFAHFSRASGRERKRQEHRGVSACHPPRIHPPAGGQWLFRGRVKGVACGFFRPSVGETILI